MLQAIKFKDKKMQNVDLVQLTSQTKKLTAMIVEDEKVTNELLSSTFKNFFSKVYSCFNGEEALATYNKIQPDVVFVDVIMAGMDGIDLSRKIREINPTQIIIVISASNDIEKISESIEVGVNSFIQKPIDTKKIIELLISVIAMVTKKKKIETKTFSISLPLDVYEIVNDSAKAESISKNAIIIRALRNFFD
jgi:YesN/AraC family two-component response regulator